MSRTTAVQKLLKTLMNYVIRGLDPFTKDRLLSL